VDNVAGVSEGYGASIFMVEVCRVGEFVCVYKHIVSEQLPEIKLN
jgi:hypothetical protein